MIELTDSLTSIWNQREVLPEAERLSWLSSPSMPGSCSALVQSVGAVKSQVGPPVLDDDEDELVVDDEDELDELVEELPDEALPDDEEDVSSLFVVLPPTPPPPPPRPVSSVPP